MPALPNKQIPETPMTTDLQIPMPPCAQHLGWTLLEQDASAGHVRIGFTPRPEFLNPAGYVQGGFLTAMLDDCMGPAVWFQSRGRIYTVTIGMNVNFLRSVRLEPLIGEGRVMQLGKTVGFLEARLFDAQEQSLAHATASVRLMSAERLGVGRAE
jgi:uncharacterized protein (TIGR00369 family)